MAERGDVASTSVDTDGTVTITYRDGSREVRSADGHASTIFPDGTARTRTPQGVETTTYPDGTVIGKGSPEALPIPEGPTMPDESGGMTVRRDANTTERTNADGSLDIVSADGSWVHIPAPPQRPVPAAGETWTHTVTATDGTRLDIAPDGSRKVTSPHGDVSYPAWPSPDRPPAPPVVTYDDDGTRHEYTNDGTHTIIEKVGEQEIRTVIPALPTTARDKFEELERVDPNPARPGWVNHTPDGPDPTLQRVHPDGRIDVIHTDGTVVQLPPLPASARPQDSSGWVESAKVDPDGTVSRRLLDPLPTGPRPAGSPEHAGDVTSYADGTHVRDDWENDLVVIDPEGRQIPVSRRFNPWAAATVGTVLIAVAGGIALSSGGDGESSLGGLAPAASVVDTPAASVGDAIPICPAGGRSRTVPCPDDLAVETTTAPIATIATTVPPTTLASVSVHAGRWVLESGLDDPEGRDVALIPRPNSGYVLGPSNAEFVVDDDGQIRNGSYSTSYTAQTECGSEVVTASQDQTTGQVNGEGVGRVAWSGVVDVQSSGCGPLSFENTAVAVFWITGDVAVLCDNAMTSPTECDDGPPKATFRRAG